jgi:extracellular elastinolytic metalloproteinase
VLRARPALVVTAAAFAAAAVPSAAMAQGGRGAAPAARDAGKPFLDVRSSLPASARRAPSAPTRAARSRLRGEVDVDPLTGTPRVLGGTGAPLSGPAAGDPADIAMRYVREHLTLLGLTDADLGTLHLESRVRGAGGTTQVPFSQFTDGLPAFDNSLQVVVAADGSVLRVLGAPQHALSVDTVPRLTAPEAMRRLLDNVGGRGQVQVTRGPAGATRKHEFASGDTAELVAFGEGDSSRLGWKVSAFGPNHAWYAAVVDADTGAILYRANRTKFDDSASVWEQYPGATNGGTQATRSLTPYLDAGATDLSGPYAHVWSDLNDDFFRNGTGPANPATDPDVNEAIPRNGSGNFTYAFTPFTQSAGACDTAHQCSWNFDVANSWQTHRAQNGVQTFYYVNKYRDHLAAAPISFSAADGDFQGGDRVLVNTDDGANTGTGARSGKPDANHVDNAFMATPPNGQSPIMAMFLFFNNGDFRDVNGGDDAAIVYHEFTHGLSNRLITVAPGGDGALNQEQAGAMGEGWSDWYAKDFLVDQFPGDDTAAPGEVDMGKYTDSVPHTIRSQGLDCPVGSSSPNCPGTLASQTGGYTYGDYNTTDIDPDTGVHEVHEGGEIWGETLWDLRDALNDSPIAEQIITEGMRQTVAEPSFLDARDGIIAADKAIFGQGAHTATIWQVFAHRGMGTEAQAGVRPDPLVDAPVEDFNRPPTVTLSAAPQPADAGDTVTLDASGTIDPDGTVSSYRFNFGDGSSEVTQPSPTIDHVYAANGAYTATVTATDNDTGQEAATTSVQIGPVATPTPTPTPSSTPSPSPSPIATATPTPPPASKAPVITLPRSGTRARVRFTVTCDSGCVGTAKLTVSKALARKLGLGRKRTLVVRTVRLSRAGTKRYTLKLSKKVTRAMKREGMRRLKTSLSVSVRDTESQRASASKKPSIRR